MDFEIGDQVHERPVERMGARHLGCVHPGRRGRDGPSATGNLGLGVGRMVIASYVGFGSTMCG
jgi:hypothetical protein